MARKKILWLCSWYPNRVDPFDGDFIQRHARAAALYNDIHVIRLVADTSIPPGLVDKQQLQQNHLTEELIYLGKGKGLLGKLIFYFRQEKLFKSVVKNYLTVQGTPPLVHVQVPYPAGRFALWLKKKYALPYVVTEHWTIYQPGNPVPYIRQPARLRSVIRRVIRGAELFLPVSRDLGNQVNQLVTPVPQQVIPNVVDTNLFCYVKQVQPENRPFRYIHVSGMSEQKNPAGLLRAFAAAYQADPEMELFMLGNRDQSMKRLADELGLPPDAVQFGGEVTYPEVAQRMQESDALVLFSQLENAPCVISEALCCGLPVIATRTGGIPEMLDGSNGVLVTPGDETSLKNALLNLKQNSARYNRAEIAFNAAAIYNYDTVGKELSAVYKQLTG